MNKTSQNLGTCSRRNSSAHGYCGCHRDAYTDENGKFIPSHVIYPGDEGSSRDPDVHKTWCMSQGDRTPAYYEEFNGSCCLSDGTCIQTGKTDCESQGGSWDGQTYCDQRDCSKAPEEPTESFASARNFYKRAKASSPSTGCPGCTRKRFKTAQEEFIAGACCVNGECKDGHWYEDDCKGVGGTWMGEGTACSGPNAVKCE